MKTKSAKLNPEECLPKHLVVKDVDDVLYRIGLCLTSVKEQPKRHSIDNPMLAFVITLIFLIEKVITCSLSEDNQLVFRMLGSTGQLLGIRIHDLFFILCSLLSLVSQMIYYYNHKQRVCPTFLRLFRMMSGTVPPKDLGLTDVEEVVRLCRNSVKWFRLLRYHNDYWIQFIAPVFVLSVYYYKTTILDIFIFGIPNAIHFTLLARYYWNVFCYQFLMFHFICTYLRIKVKTLNSTAERMTRSRKLVKIRELIRSYHLVANEIHDYNVSYWSKFLLNFWLSYGLTVILLLHSVVFISMQLLLKLIFIYTLFAFTFTFLLLIMKTSSVNNSANISHKTITSLFVFYSRHNKHPKSSLLFNKMKVCIL